MVDLIRQASVVCACRHLHLFGRLGGAGAQPSGVSNVLCTQVLESELAEAAAGKRTLVALGEWEV